MKIENLPSWLRWLLIIPATFLAWVVVYALNHLCVMLVFGLWLEPDSNLIKAYDMFISNASSVIVAILAGAHVAPAKKKQVAIASATLFAIFGAVSVWIRLTSPDYYVYTNPNWEIYGSGLVKVLSAIYASMKIATVDEHEIELK